jgi:hypothetical protein
MKLYLKILGILCLLFAIVALVFIIIDFVNYEDIEIFILVIPLYVLLHYLLLTKLGFTSDFKIKSKLFSVITIISFIVFICLPLIYIGKDVSNKKMIEELKVPKILTDTTLYDIDCLIKTRYDNKNLDYLFRAEYIKEDIPTIKAYHVSFIDKDGFVVYEIKIDEWIKKLDVKTNNIGGCRANGKFKLDSKEYARIADVDIAISKKE